MPSRAALRRPDHAPPTARARARSPGARSRRHFQLAFALVDDEDNALGVTPQVPGDLAVRREQPGPTVYDEHGQVSLADGAVRLIDAEAESGSASAKSRPPVSINS